MAKPTITSLGPELLREIRAVIAAEKRRVAGDLRDDPRNPEKAPDDYLVKTPAGGIPASVKTSTGRRIYSANCAVYRQTETSPGTPGAAKDVEPILEEPNDEPYTLFVYNVYCVPVPGNLIVPTALLKSGTRYVLNWFECDDSSSPSESSPSESESSPSDSESSPSDSESSPSESESSPSDSDSVLSDSASAPSDSESEASESTYPCPGQCAYEWVRPGGYPVDPDKWQTWDPFGMYNCGPAEECTCPPASTIGRNGAFLGEIVYLSCVDIDTVPT